MYFTIRATSLALVVALVASGCATPPQPASEPSKTMPSTPAADLPMLAQLGADGTLAFTGCQVLRAIDYVPLAVAEDPDFTPAAHGPGNAFARADTFVGACKSVANGSIQESNVGFMLTLFWVTAKEKATVPGAQTYAVLEQVMTPSAVLQGAFKFAGFDRVEPAKSIRVTVTDSAAGRSSLAEATLEHPDFNVQFRSAGASPMTAASSVIGVYLRGKEIRGLPMVWMASSVTGPTEVVSVGGDAFFPAFPDATTGQNEANVNAVLRIMGRANATAPPT